MTTEPTGIDPSASPSGTGCQECELQDGWWFHLRRCAQCGHIGCCDTSPAQHATAHARTTGHPLITSFEPGESWYYDYRDQQMRQGLRLAPPERHPSDQPAPGPADRVPANWQSQLR
ncbi:MAG: UBP-type zinc finger domain-containing protein [Jatrophihabitantaceae bacterium]